MEEISEGWSELLAFDKEFVKLNRPVGCGGGGFGPVREATGLLKKDKVQEQCNHYKKLFAGSQKISAITLFKRLHLLSEGPLGILGESRGIRGLSSLSATDVLHWPTRTSALSSVNTVDVAI